MSSDYIHIFDPKYEVIKVSSSIFREIDGEPVTVYVGYEIRPGHKKPSDYYDPKKLLDIPPPEIKNIGYRPGKIVNRGSEKPIVYVEYDPFD
ncbi:MAG: hypothetical protein QXD48_02570 [Candidatus Aenigmatarchaeota archaeon]